MSIAPNAARVYLPTTAHPPATVLEFLCERFPQIEEQRWRQRILDGKVSSEAATPINAATPYLSGATVFYFREVEDEVVIPFREEIFFQNDHFLVVDKPHFLPVTPAGDCVNECLLYRLQRRTGIPDLAPLHRLDRDTAGLVLFSTSKSTRGTYHSLFAQNKILRKYLAIAHADSRIANALPQRWLVENRLEAGEPWFRMAVTNGQLNARTEIVLKNIEEKLAIFELHPHTGKKHQLRLHMSAIGFPIINDRLYPHLQSQREGQYDLPLQLLASQLSFEDPITREALSFESRQKLSFSRE